MKNLLSSLAIGLVALVATDRAYATSINFVTADSPVIDVPLAAADYFEFGGVGDFTIFDAEGLATPASIQTGTLFLDILINFDVSDPGDINGGLFSIDENGAFLEGSLVQSGFDGGILELLFSDLSGSAAADFGEFARVDILFLNPFPGNDPLSNLADGTTYDVAATVSSVAPIPLPAALPLLLAGLGGLVLLQRRG